VPINDDLSVTEQIYAQASHRRKQRYTPLIGNVKRVFVDVE